MKYLNACQDTWAYKIPDDPKFSGADSRFSLKKPFDIILHTKAPGGYEVAYIEAKVCKQMTFPFSDIRDHQRDNLDFLNSLNGNTFYLVNFRVKETKKRSAINRCFLIDTQLIDEAIHTYSADSVNIDWCVKYAQEVNKIKLEGKIAWELKW